MRALKRYQIILFSLFIIAIFTIHFQSLSSGISGAQITGPVQFSVESWTDVIGTPGEDQGTALAIDPISGDVYWGLTSNFGGSTIGEVSRVMRNGTIEWSKSLIGYFGLNSSNPSAIVSSADGVNVFVACLFSNATANNALAMFMLNATSGIIVNATTLAMNITPHINMDWANSTTILLAFTQTNTFGDINVYLSFFWPALFQESNLTEISFGNMYNWPNGLQCNSNDRTGLLTIHEQDNTGIDSSWLFLVNDKQALPTYQSYPEISINGNSNFQPLNGIRYGTHIFFLVHNSTMFALMSLDDSFNIQFYSTWNITNFNYEGLVANFKRSCFDHRLGKLPHLG